MVNFILQNSPHNHSRVVAVSISMQCGCSRSFKIKDELAGKKIRCPECKAVLAVPKPEVELESDDDAANFLVAESAPVTVTPVAAGKPRARKSRDEDDDDREENEDDDEAPRPKKKSDDGFTADPSPWDKAKPEPKKDKKPKKKSRSLDSYNDDPPERSGPGIVISKSIITGILMMIGAVVWFGLGLAADRIFFYPPVLFVCGIVAVVKGAMGHEE